MKRFWVILTALVLALGISPAALSEDTEARHVADYDVCETVYGLLECGEMALADGMPAKQVLEEMYALADAGDFLEQYEATCENIAADGGRTYQKLLEYLGYEYRNNVLDVIETPAAVDDDASWTVYDCPDVSDAMRAALKDEGAQFCFQPSYWAEEDFKDVLGIAYGKFTPARPRPGYACVVIKKGAQCEPETTWNKDGSDNYDFISAMCSIVNSIALYMGDDAPVFTGNPNLASTFWVFDVSYDFYTWYGNKEVKGYDLEMTLAVRDAAAKKDAAAFKYTDRLGSTIYSWRNGVARPSLPSLYDISGFDTIVGKIVSLMQKQRGEAAASRKITAMNAEKVLGGILVEQAGKLDDAWQKAILESGPQDVDLDGNTLSFTLRSYDPELNDLGAYSGADDPEAWLDEALENAYRHGLAVELEIEDGQPTEKSLTALIKTVKAAAKTAKAAFESEDLSAAVIARLFPTPLTGLITNAQRLLKPNESFVDWVNSRRDDRIYAMEAEQLSPLFASIKSKALETKNGPRSLTVRLTAVAPEDLLSQASRSVLDKLAYQDGDERDTDAVDSLLLSALAKTAVSAKKNAKNKYEISVDLDQLRNGNYSAEYWAYIEAYTYSDALYSLQRSIDLLPSVSARDLPRNGIIRGGGSGTEVTLKLSDASNPTYVQIRKDSTDDLAAAVFIHSGDSVKLHIPKGSYRLYYCSGPYWYGEEDLFGEMGSYSKSEPTEIKGTDYTHTITLESSRNGDVSIYGSDPDEFLKP